MINNFLNQDCKDDEVFQLISQVQQIKEFVNNNYDKHVCEYTPERSSGYDDDIFYDGYNCGQSCAAYEIGQILEMDLPESEQADDI